MKKIGMVVAMKNEITAFLEAQNVEIGYEDAFGFEVMRFSLGGNNIICVQSGVGELCAAAATQTLIVKYGVDAMINFGVCGTLTEDLSTLDMALIKGVVYYDFDLSAIDDLPRGRYPGEPSCVIPTDAALADTVRAIMPDIPEAICASGDKFIADENIKVRLAEEFGANVCEMESAGVLITAKRAGVPCLIIKAVSDGKGGAEEFKALCDRAAKIYVDLVTEICKKL
ncbi:MAG: 5'-methylthioadenosine/S-adenosylhomocysteine nucleosidase [Clostridia bacterium]|nr:5'-methylthioadenosine/S-adenosylhomocysteine nucleosidase [Clostridia bacterium]